MNNRESMLEMMRDYRERPVEFFTGDEVLDVEVISSLDKTVLGCIISLTS